MTKALRTKTCHCGSVIEEGYDNSEAYWQSRKYCTVTCANHASPATFKPTDMPIQRIIKLYTEDRLSMEKIAVRFGVGRKVIRRILKQNNIKGYTFEENMMYLHGVGIIELYKILGTVIGVREYYPYRRRTLSKFLKDNGVMGRKHDTVKIPDHVRTGVVAYALSNKTTRLLCAWR